MIRPLLLFVLLCVFSLQAQDAIYHGGRIKPMDTFARDALSIMAEKTSLQGVSAKEWIFSMVNHPETTDTVPFFKVNRADVAELLHLDSRERYHSFVDFRTTRSLLQQYAERTDTHPVTLEMIRLDEALSLYESLRSAKDYERPLFEIQDSTCLQILGVDRGKKVFSAVELQRALNKLDSGAKPPQIQTFEDSLRMEFYKRSNRDLWNVFRDPKGDSTVLVSAWDYILSSEKKIPDSTELPSALQKKLSYEVGYHRVNLPWWGLIFTGIAMVLSLLGFAFSRKPLWMAAVISLALSGACLSFSLIWRSLISERPPLGNLYEVLLSVLALLIVALCISFVRWKVRWLLFLGSVLVFAGLFFGQNSLVGGDTFKMLPVLLQSSFWLSIHVLTIALGYCGMILAGLCGHAVLIAYATRSRAPILSSLEGASKNWFATAKLREAEPEQARKEANNGVISLFEQRTMAMRHSQCCRKRIFRGALEKILYGSLAFGALFTFLGTIFGGFWADVAWGRFWGWDPKENGALLVILWSMIAFHLRSGRLLSSIGFATLVACGLILIALCWFGVNLLGVGLHSYGFQGGMAIALFSFITFDAMLIGILAVVAHRRAPKNN